MAITHAEGRLRALALLWILLFGGGVIVLVVGIWQPASAQLYVENPLFAFTLVGQALLFLCSFYLLSGIRDNELCAPVLSWYKLISGTAMLLFLLGRTHSTSNLLLVIGGGLLDYLMGGVTFAFWLGARRSRALRMPVASDSGPAIEEEPGGFSARALRLGVAVSAALFAIAMVALIITGFFSPILRNAAFYEITAGNTVAVYGTLALLGLLAAEAPQRRFYALDILLVTCLLAGAVLLFWAFHFSLPAALRETFLIGGVAHLTIAVLNTMLRIQAARSERPTRFLGPWLHLIFERFAEVIIKGDIVAVTPREIADAADNLLADTPSRRVVGLKLALAFIELGSLLQFCVPMSRMGRLERMEYLTNVFARGQGFFRSLIKIKQLVFLIYYSDERTYKEIGFVKFEEREKYKQAQRENKLPTDVVIYPPEVDDRHLKADVCVIGSGAGGAVAAANLAESGKSVLILEEGSYLKRDRIDHDERAMGTKAYREGGLQLTMDFDMYVLQGRCVGGSTFLNNGICFDPPDEILTEWDKLGATIDRDRLRESLVRVRKVIQPVKLEDKPQLVERGSLKFVEGCRKLGLPSGWFEVNLDGCLGCGYCTTGCSYEKKMSMDTSYIPRALNAGATLVSDCKALKIVTRGSKAQSVEAIRSDGTPLTVEAKQIVVACGAIGSSLLLLRSGIKRNVGTRLSLNVGSWVFAEFAEPIDSFDGIQMCSYHKQPRYALESFAMPPGTFAASMPGWFRDHFDKMRSYRHYAVAGVLVGSEPAGRVIASSIPIVGELLSPISFSLPISDLWKIREGIKQACRMELAAGARRVIPATFTPVEFFEADQLDYLDELIIEPDDVSTGSAHPQGGNPMSDDEKVGAVDTKFRVYGFENLFVCDASVFPTSVKVNPQVSVMGMADYASRIIAQI